jgi:hypothetical protein
MKKLLLLLCLALPSFGACTLGSNGYSHCRSITINSSQITGTLTNYIFTVSGTKTYLATVANGGLVQNASGFDHIYTSDSAGTTKLNWCPALWTNMGVVEYKINIPSAAVGTVIYEFYGNASVTTDQSGGCSAAFDSNYKAIWPFPDGTSPNSNDFSSNGNNLGKSNPGVVVAVAGEFDGAIFGNGSLLNVSTDVASLKITGPITAECWVNNQSSSATALRVILSKWSSGDSYVLFANTTTGTVAFEILVSGVGKLSGNSSGNILGFGWHHVAGVFDGSNVLVYLDGSITTGDATAGPINNSTDLVYVGSFGTGGNVWAGYLDDCRISNTNRSAAWIAATVNNGNQAAFSTTSAPSDLSGFVANPTIITVGP